MNDELPQRIPLSERYPDIPFRPTTALHANHLIYIATCLNEWVEWDTRMQEAPPQNDPNPERNE